MQAIPDKKPTSAGLYLNRPHMEDSRNDALALGVAAPHPLDVDRSRIQIPQQLVDASAAEHTPDVLLDALSSKEPAAFLGKLPLKRLLADVFDAQA
jgi:hypothetical protein